ncbi:hypothetical protein ACIQK9_18450 [Streptomyces hydrogenans]|uniref:hypothetical protein n=1 Tax=Streptomyces hydrogenans TaxID=1873719 RepID=UPI00380372A2
MGERWFLLAGEGEYGEESGLARLEHVPHELTEMRRALQSLGMREIPRPPGVRGERGLHEVRQELGAWLQSVRTGEQEPPLSLFVYCTGHGERESDDTWGLAMPTHTEWTTALLKPSDIINTLHGGGGDRKKELFEQAVVVLDACYSEPGAGDAMETRRRQSAVGRAEYDAWVIATARRAQQAQQLAFAHAFAKALSGSDGTQEFIEPSVLVERINGHLPTDSQEVWVSSTDRRGCRVLPDPAYMPRTSPEWLDRELDEWSHLARGRSGRRQPGWYFSGRAEEQRRLREFIAGGGPAGPLILRGAAGVGKSALLGHLAVSGRTEWRRLLPPVARRGLILPDGSVHALVTAEDAGVPGLTWQIARALGLDLGNAPTPDDLCDALEDLSPRTVLVDDLHLASDDLATVVRDLLDPLAEYARTVVIAAAGHASAADEAWQTLGLPLLQLGTDEEGVSAYARARGAEEIAAACHGHFGAAVHAVDAFLGTPHDQDAGAGARRAAGKRLTHFHHSLLAARGREDDWCRAMLEPVRAAAAVGHEAGLTAEHWAALATAADRSGRTYDPEEAREAANLLAEALTSTTSTPPDPGTGPAPATGTGSAPAWRLATPVAPESRDQRFAAAVRDCLPVRGAGESGEPGIDWTADLPLTALFASAARHFEEAFVAELSEPAFWTALPGGVLARQLDGGGARVLPPGVGDGVRRQTAGLQPAERAFQLKLHLLRSGEEARGLNPRDLGAAVDVLWATRKDDVPVPDLLAVASGASGDGYVVTTHGDASLRLWNLADGALLRVAARSAREGIASHLSLAVVGGEPVVAFVADGAGLLWHPLTDTDPEPLPVLDGATAFSLHTDGLLAVARDTRIEVVAPGAGGRTRSVTLPGSSRVTQVYLAGGTGDGRLVATTEFGTVAARVLATGVTAVRRQPLLMPLARQAVVSSTGRTVGVLDRRGGLYVWDENHGTRGLDIPATRDGTLAFAVDDSLAAVVGGARKPWLCLRPLTSAEERPASRLPLPDQPVALAFDAAGSRLVVTDLHGVFCLDVAPIRPHPPRSAPAGSDPDPGPPSPSPTTDRSEEAR